MTARVKEWRGQEIARKVRDAAVEAIDETTEACARQAAAGRSGSIANIESEAASGDPPTGRWGLFPGPAGDPWYELFWEVGTAFIPGDNAKRRAADDQYGQLADRIRSRVE